MPWEVPVTPGWPTKFASGSCPAALGHSTGCGGCSHLHHLLVEKTAKEQPDAFCKVRCEGIASRQEAEQKCWDLEPVCSPLLSHLVLGTDTGRLSRKGLETFLIACALCITHSVCSCFPSRDEGLSARTKTSAPAVSGCSPRVPCRAGSTASTQNPEPRSHSGTCLPLISVGTSQL